MKKTVKGIHLDIDPRVPSDIRTVRLMTDLYRNQPSRDLNDAENERRGAEASDIMFRLWDTVFGADSERIEAELRAKNDGFLSFADMNQFLMDVLGEYQKNAGARPAPGA